MERAGAEGEDGVAIPYKDRKMGEGEEDRKNLKWSDSKKREMQ